MLVLTHYFEDSEVGWCELGIWLQGGTLYCGVGEDISVLTSDPPPSTECHTCFQALTAKTLYELMALVGVVEYVELSHLCMRIFAPENRICEAQEGR